MVVEEVEDGGEGDLQSILLASGADAAVFPERFATAGMESGHPTFNSVMPRDTKFQSFAWAQECSSRACGNQRARSTAHFMLW